MITKYYNQYEFIYISINKYYCLYFEYNYNLLDNVCIIDKFIKVT